MKLKQAIDIMIPLSEYPRVLYSTTLRETIAFLQGFQVDKESRKSLPRIVLVTNEAGHLIGVVGRRDILRGMESAALASMMLRLSSRKEGSGEISDDVLQSLRQNARRPVSDVMARFRGTLSHDDYLINIVEKIIDFNVSLLPVMKDGEVVGVVRTVEILDAVGSLLNE
jgi:CBS domain-containing protein